MSTLLLIRSQIIMKCLKPQPNCSSGFTLIEMLITITISLLIISIGVANYLDFNARQKILGAAKELEVLIQSAQAKARGGDLADCDKLDSYQISLNLSANPVAVALQPNCVDINLGTAYLGTTIKSYTLITEVVLETLPAITEIKFPVLNGGIIFPGNVPNVALTFSSPSISKKYQLILSKGGDLSEGVWQ